MVRITWQFSIIIMMRPIYESWMTSSRFPILWSVIALFIISRHYWLSYWARQAFSIQCTDLADARKQNRMYQWECFTCPWVYISCARPEKSPQTMFGNGNCLQRKSNLLMHQFWQQQFCFSYVFFFFWQRKHHDPFFIWQYYFIFRLVDANW